MVHGVLQYAEKGESSMTYNQIKTLERYKDIKRLQKDADYDLGVLFVTETDDEDEDYFQFLVDEYKTRLLDQEPMIDLEDVDFEQIMLWLLEDAEVG